MSDTPPELLYKILTAERWAGRGAEGPVPIMPIDETDGFVHLSTADQLAETLALHFRGQGRLPVIAIRTADIEPDLRWEPSRGGQLFPHVYGDIPLAAVAWTGTADVGADGTVELPDRVG